MNVLTWMQPCYRIEARCCVMQRRPSSSATTGSLITLHYSFRRDVRPSPTASTRVGGPPRSLFYGELIINAAARLPAGWNGDDPTFHGLRPTTSPSTMELRGPYDPLALINNFSTLFSLASRASVSRYLCPQPLSYDLSSVVSPLFHLCRIDAGSIHTQTSFNFDLQTGVTKFRHDFRSHLCFTLTVSLSVWYSATQ